MAVVQPRPIMPVMSPTLRLRRPAITWVRPGLALELSVVSQHACCPVLQEVPAPGVGTAAAKMAKATVATTASLENISRIERVKGGKDCEVGLLM